MQGGTLRCSILRPPLSRHRPSAAFDFTAVSTVRHRRMLTHGRRG